MADQLLRAENMTVGYGGMPLIIPGKPLMLPMESKVFCMQSGQMQILFGIWIIFPALLSGLRHT